jgi:hypothetical protein
LTDQVGLADSLLATAKSTELIAIAGQANSPQSAKPTAPVGSTDSPVTNTVNEHDELSNQPSKTFNDVGANLYDWRTPLLIYLRDPSAKVDKSVRRSAFQVCVHNDELY